MIKGSIQEEDSTIINKQAPDAGAPRYTQQILTDIKGEIDGNTIIAGDFNIPLTTMDGSSRQKIYKDTLEELKLANGDLSKLDEIVKSRLRKEIEKGIQTIQYQVVTLMTTNGLYGAIGRYKIAWTRFIHWGEIIFANGSEMSNHIMSKGT